MRDSRFATSSVRRVLTAIAAGALIAGCSSTGAGSATAPATSAAGAGTEVSATEAEFQIKLAATTAAPGPVTFHVRNGGTTVHEFVVMRTDFPADKLPIAPGAPEVEEDAPGLTAIDEVEDLVAGTTSDLTLQLAAGHYVVICNVPGHYQSGMHADFVVGG